MAVGIVLNGSPASQTLIVLSQEPDTILVPSWLKSTEVTCTSPLQPGGAGPQSVEVTMNGQQFSRSEVQFAYHTPETVTSLSPASGAT